MIADLATFFIGCKSKYWMNFYASRLKINIVSFWRYLNLSEDTSQKKRIFTIFW
jgi:hypothetical protein